MSDAEFRTYGEHSARLVPPTPLLVDRREAARLLGISASSVDNLRNAGELPSLKIGARRLYDVADLHRFIEVRKRSIKAASEGGAA